MLDHAGCSRSPIFSRRLPRYHRSFLPNDHDLVQLGEDVLDRLMPLNDHGLQHRDPIHKNCQLVLTGMEHYSRYAELSNAQPATNPADHPYSWSSITAADVELPYTFDQNYWLGSDVQTNEVHGSSSPGVQSGGQNDSVNEYSADTSKLRGVIMRLHFGRLGCGSGIEILSSRE